MKQKIFPLPYFFLLILIFTTFFLKSIVYLDPDFGWYMKMGELISTSGIPKTDPFSYTMPSYPLVDHEWISNLLIYQFYPILGHLGLSIIYGLIGLSSLLIITFKRKVELIFIPLTAGAIMLIPFVGVRDQVVGWSFYSILLLITLNQNIWNRYKYFLPILFLIWANFHGSFIIGVGILGLKILLTIPFLD